MLLTLGDFRCLVRESIDDESSAWLVLPNGEVLTANDHTELAGELCGVPRYTEMFADDPDGKDYERYRDDCAHAHARLHAEGMITIRLWLDNEFAVTMHEMTSSSLRRLQGALEEIGAGEEMSVLIYAGSTAGGAYHDSMRMSVNDVLLARNVAQLRSMNNVNEGFEDWRRGQQASPTGWWVMKDGAVEVVDRGEEHGDVAARICGNNVDPDDHSDATAGAREQSYEQLYLTGCMAIRCWRGSSPTVQVHTFDEGALRRLQAALEQVMPWRTSEIITIDAHSPMKGRGMVKNTVRVRMGNLQAARNVRDVVELDMC